MPKVSYDGIKFDSELEVEYYKHLKENNLLFEYHPKTPIQITKNNTYTPDFIVFYNDRIEIIETKGYNQFSFMKDNMIHNVMLSKSEEELKSWLKENNIYTNEYRSVVYKKIKYLKSYGWVDFDFKNPNTLSNQRKNKIKELEEENKRLKADLRGFIKYYEYLHTNKPTKAKKDYIMRFERDYEIKSKQE